jgi:acyl carrier protein
MTTAAAASSVTADLTPMEIHTIINRFLARFVDDPEVLSRDRLLTGGMLDSLAMVELIAYLEKRFGFPVLDEDLEIENFDSIDAITALASRKLAR